MLPDPTLRLEESIHLPAPRQVFEWVERTPDAAAVEQGGRRWSYAELARAARHVGAALSATGARRGEPVGLTGPRSFGLIAAWLGAWNVGAVVIPIDESLPELRKRAMLEAAAARAVLGVKRESTGCPWFAAGWSVVHIDAASGVPDAQGRAGDTDADRQPPCGDDPAYVFLTSGSTGEPKGVLGVHKGLSHFLDWQRAAFAVKPGDRVAQLTQLSFDPILRDIFLPLTSGATLVLPEEDDFVDVPEWLARARITVVHTVPAVARRWLQARPAGVPLPDLRWALFAGEALTGELVQRWRQAFPGAYGVANMYGPTETTMAKFCFVVPDPPAPGVQPVGWPLPGTQGLVLQGDRCCAIGESGEVVIRSPFRTAGYLEGTAERRPGFLPNPFRADRDDLIYRTGDLGRYRADGALEVIGRLDGQLKVHGVRVQPAEIEAVLERHASVHEAAVVGVADGDGETSLAAYVVMVPGSEVSSGDLRTWLARHLPATIWPTTISVVPGIPRLPNGKTDRCALAASCSASLPSPAGSIAPRGDVEPRLAEIFAQVLRLDVAQVGAEQNFFELGGDSLGAMQVLARIRDRLGAAVTTRQFFEAPTVAALAVPVAAASARQPGAGAAARPASAADEHEMRRHPHPLGAMPAPFGGTGSARPPLAGSIPVRGEPGRNQ